MNDKPALSEVEPLNENHNLDQFDCGEHKSLTTWLRQFARTNQAGNSSRTFVVHRAARVVGYYSLAASSVGKEQASIRAAKGQPNHPVPVILLARLAVDKTEQHQGLGPALLKDALLRCQRAALEIGARAVLVHAIDETARGFYRHFGFEDCAVDDLHLMLLIKDIKRPSARERH
ncbi:MAG TPA: GNAT family N-acetyltransferase [Candidatus Sulfotelmatobacter sp.]